MQKNFINKHNLFIQVILGIITILLIPVSSFAEKNDKTHQNEQFLVANNNNLYEGLFNKLPNINIYKTEYRKNNFSISQSYLNKIIHNPSISYLNNVISSYDFDNYIVVFESAIVDFAIKEPLYKNLRIQNPNQEYSSLTTKITPIRAGPTSF